MQNPRLASRYAKSLLDLAIEQNNLDVTLQDMELFDTVCRQNREFVNVLRSPVIKADKKQAIIQAIFGERIHTLTKAFINLLINKGREGNLNEIAHAFIGQYKKLKQIKTVTLTTAVPIADKVKDAIRTRVASGMPENTIEMNTVVNPDLIGGFVLEMEDKLFDASVLRDLKNIKSSLLDHSYVAKI